MCGCIVLAQPMGGEVGRNHTTKVFVFSSRNQTQLASRLLLFNLPNPSHSHLIIHYFFFVPIWRDDVVVGCCLATLNKALPEEKKKGEDNRSKIQQHFKLNNSLPDFCLIFTIPHQVKKFRKKSSLLCCLFFQSLISPELFLSFGPGTGQPLSSAADDICYLC